MSIILNGNTIAGHTPPQSYRFVGEIFQSAIPINDTKVALLDGHRITSSEGYGQFIQYITSVSFIYPQLACTEEEWQNTVTAYGECGKFVIGDSYVRLPKIVSFVQGLSSLNDLANIVQAGLPNITGSIGTGEATPLLFAHLTSGAFKNAQNNLDYPSTGNFVDTNDRTAWVDFDASLSNPIYGNSDTVQPQAIQYPYYIVLATGVTQNIQVIEEIEYNIPHSLGESKYSPITLNNLSWLKSEGQWNPASIHSSFYDWLLREYNNPDVLAKFNKDAFTVVGSPTITEDGIASGFSKSDYIQIPQIFAQSSSWEIITKITLSGALHGQDYFCNYGRQSLVLNMSNGILSWSLSSTGTNWDLFTGRLGKTKLQQYSTYFIKIQFTGEKYNLLLSHDNINWSLEDSFSSTAKIYNTEYSVMGINRLGDVGITGSIDLKQFSITVDGVKTFSGADSSVKLVTEAYDDYDFVLNTTNKTFRLPLLDGSEDLPSEKYEDWTLNASGSPYTAPANGYFNMAYAGASSDSFVKLYCNNIEISHHESSSNWKGLVMPVKKGDILTIEYRNMTLRYFRFIYAQGNGSLYYYVGETVQNANLINAGRIEETLVNHASKPHIIETYVNGTSWYRVWSPDSTGKRWCEQGGISLEITQSLTFLKTFATIPNLIATKYTSSTDSSGSYAVRVLNLTPQGCTIRYDSYTADVNGYCGAWQACGYIA